ncbi:hypothetical protein [Hyphomonas oceanitis]|uniref:hypothetical protein n=1 Tax=Hyphomonas oceanitis TaxID=81033 RepID=UPI0030037982
MNRFAVALFALGMATACGGPADAKAPDEKAKTAVTPMDMAALPADALVLSRTQIEDPGVIAQMNALNILVPKDWTPQGGLVPSRDRCSEIFGVDWSAKSPDGKSVVFIFPTEGWQATNAMLQLMCPPAEFQSAQQYLSTRVGQMFPGARIENYRARDELARAAADYASDMQQMSQQNGIDMQIWADGGELTFTFSRDGVKMKGMLAVTGMYFVSSAYNPMGGPPMQTLTGNTLGTFGTIMPEERYNPELAEAVRRSVTPNPEWLKHLFGIKKELGKIAVADTKKRAAMIVAGGAAATRQNIAAFEGMTAATRANGMPDPIKTADYPRRSTTDETDDRIQRESIEGIRGVETYHDPIGEVNVQLDATYDNAWRVTNDETYILTNDPNFNPGQYNIEATQLQVLK